MVAEAPWRTEASANVPEDPSGMGNEVLAEHAPLVDITTWINRLIFNDHFVMEMWRRGEAGPA
jgi:hypothetical protein